MKLVWMALAAAAIVSTAPAQAAVFTVSAGSGPWDVSIPGNEIYSNEAGAPLRAHFKFRRHSG
jgi:hypothetical protein